MRCDCSGFVDGTESSGIRPTGLRLAELSDSRVPGLSTKIIVATSTCHSRLSVMGQVLSSNAFPEVLASIFHLAAHRFGNLCMTCNSADCGRAGNCRCRKGCAIWLRQCRLISRQANNIVRRSFLELTSSPWDILSVAADLENCVDGVIESPVRSELHPEFDIVSTLR